MPVRRASRWLRDGRDMALDHLAQPCGWGGAHESVGLPAVLDDEKQWDALDAVACGDGRCLVDVELDDLQAAGVLASHLLDDG